MMLTSRRQMMGWAALGAGGLALAPRLALAQTGGEKRFVFIIQRGAADGLNTVIPYADPAYAQLRGSLAIDVADATRLDGTFALHKSLAKVGELYASGQAKFVHAVGLPYLSRSHFNAQNVLECGGRKPYELNSGWVNRLLTLLPPGKGKAVALASAMPMAMRGSMPVMGYQPAQMADPEDELLQRLSGLYQDDPQLHGLWEAAVDVHAEVSDIRTGRSNSKVGTLAGTLLGKRNGARVAMIETSGWDTHNAQNAVLTKSLTILDNLISSLRDALGDAWKDTLVIVATEFGRTAAVNGTGGTDHGTGGLAMVLGGTIQGGQVISDWPGLSPSALYENRDLKPTTALDTIITQALSEHYGWDPEVASQTLFPRT
ncbi:DUF1501 domain-containing protein [Novosphingobium mangrovi (ex Hu et al. 2023)]|uniref:DUF1501 domain-containing protein n=1 Tax=Novosphingobium mangrovi (ex Hu et al. 2023) TaxID=2930094 RepID=A0ABT0ACA1_9SPHN|nr:DUF1501 domain-containing protein [Novosphingobium mangrovi (ex Hu et al. 2023)]MCJ1960822.1 DUF1501 domain-containing protein [Novosphingobium mangrovi (ex Hu et al. 2023)]